MVLFLSVVILSSAFAVYYYMNRHKPLKIILRDLKYAIDMQGAGAAGLIDDWINLRRNKAVLPDARERVAVITGGARGIGYEVIRGLLQANMTVVMGVRRPELAQKMRETMKNGENLHAYQLDLTSLKSVKEFAGNVLKNFKEIHLLINNAGIMYTDFQLTEDKIESQLAVNHLSHFYLTNLLLPALKRGGSKINEPARVVNVSSCAHHPGTIYFNDMNMNKHYNTIASYAQSKLAQLMSARYINKLLEDEGSPVRCYSVHPGIVDTGLFEKTHFKNLPWLTKRLFKSPEKGATTVLFTCFDKDLNKRGGLYISNCIEGISNSFSKKVENQKRLFEVSCDLANIEKEKFGLEIN